MSATFTSAILFAVAHHIFYSSLDGQSVSKAMFGQQVTTAAGTAFAFLVRACRALSISTAFVQVLWQALLRQPNGLAVATVDSLSSLLSSLTALLSLHATWRYPTIVCIAIISWTLPLSTVIPPATLSVESARTTNFTIMPVPIIDWDHHELFLSGIYTGARAVGTGNPAKPYNATYFEVYLSQVTINYANIVAFSRQLPALPMIALNSSYQSTFSAPALQCTNPPADTIFGDWSRNCTFYKHNPYFWDGINESYFFSPWPNTPAYMSWIPVGAPVDVTTQSSARARVVPEHSNGYMGCDHMSQQAQATTFGYSSFTPELFVAVATGPSDASINDYWSLTHCQLRNATYTVQIDFHNGLQNATVIDKTFTPLKPISHAAHFPLINKTITDDPYNTTYANYYRSIYNYYSIMNMVGYITAGVVSYTQAGLEPNIFLTQLAYTKELSLFYKNETWSKYKPLESWTYSDAVQPMASALEELFENFTLGLLSADRMAHHTGQANVSLWQPQNIYSYSWRPLTLSYGIGILVAGITVAIGAFTTLTVNKVSYASGVSTFLRITRWEDIADLASVYDDGAGPLPPSLAKAFVRFGQRSTSPLESHNSRKLQLYSEKSRVRPTRAQSI